VEVPAWSVSIITGQECLEEFNTKKSISEHLPNKQTIDVLPTEFILVDQLHEPTPSSNANNGVVPTFISENPVEQLSLTKDNTDYLWYSNRIEGNKGESQLTFTVAVSGGN